MFPNIISKKLNYIETKIKEMYKKGCKKGNFDVITKCINEYYHFLNTLSENNIILPFLDFEWAIDIAYEYKHVNVVETILNMENKIDIMEYAIVAICKHNVKELIKKTLNLEIVEKKSTDIFNIACECNHVDVIDEMILNGNVDDEDICSNFSVACEYGYLESAGALMDHDGFYMRSNGVEEFKDGMISSFENKHFDIFNMLYNICSKGNLGSVFSHACKNGKYDMINTFMDLGFNINKDLKKKYITRKPDIIAILLGHYFDNYKNGLVNIDYDIYNDILNRIKFYYYRIVNNKDESERINWLYENNYKNEIINIFF